mgnify:CR=1 FL=1
MTDRVRTNNAEVMNNIADINEAMSKELKGEKVQAHLNVKVENINEVVERILKRLRPIAAQKNVELVY